ncbi:hypothetical protein DL98DRAFT_583794 [Cadophora sp. DSE1049]|nr:hypothetical protein DL98DRAFT_583794 [Cadophora sp. DSE1049]
MLPQTRYQKVTAEDMGDISESKSQVPLAQWLFRYRTAFYVVLVVYIITAVASHSYENGSGSGNTRSAVELAAGLPHVPFDRVVLFDADASYASYMNGIDDPWTKKLLPPGRGLIKVPIEVAQPDRSTKLEDKPFSGLKWIFESEDNIAVNKTSEAYIMKKSTWRIASTFYARQ